MKIWIQILFFLLTWITTFANATPPAQKLALPTYCVSFSTTENQKPDNEVKIGIQSFARSGISENEPQTTYLETIPFFKTFFSNNEQGNFSALTFEKDLSKRHYSSFNFSKKERLSLLENRARDELVKYVQGAGKLLDDIVLAIKAYFPTHGNPMNLLMKVTPNNTEVA